MSDTQRALRWGRPIWLRRRGRVTPRRYPALSGRHETTVAIVGGGMTGALVAYMFASAGISTVVLEAEGVGRGSTAASSALLLQEPDLELIQLTKRYGSRASRRMWQLGEESHRGLVELLKRLRIPCDLATRDAIYYARDEHGAERLRREFNLRRRAGFAAEWLTPGELRNITGIPARAAIRTRGNAQFDPYCGCVGVLRSAVAAGTQVFERSPVRRIDAVPDHVRLRTGRGVLDARGVVIATGYATREFRPLAGRFRMYRTYVLATEPIDANNGMIWASLTSWSGTPNGPITMRVGHPTGGSCWAVATAWSNQVPAAAGSPKPRLRSCARTLRRSCRHWRTSKRHSLGRACSR